MDKERTAIKDSLRDSAILHPIVFGFSLKNTAAINNLNIHQMRQRFYAMVDPGGSCGPKHTEARYLLDQTHDHFGFVNLLADTPYNFSLSQAHYINLLLSGMPYDEIRSLFSNPTYPYQLHRESREIIGMAEQSYDPEVWQNYLSQNDISIDRFSMKQLGRIAFSGQKISIHSSFEESVVSYVAHGLLPYEIALKLCLPNHTLDSISAEDINSTAFNYLADVNDIINNIFVTYPDISYPQLIQLCRISSGDLGMGAFEKRYAEALYPHISLEHLQHAYQLLNNYTQKDQEQILHIARNYFPVTSLWAVSRFLGYPHYKPQPLLKNLGDEINVHPDAFRNKLRLMIKDTAYSEKEYLELLGSVIALQLHDLFTFNKQESIAFHQDEISEPLLEVLIINENRYKGYFNKITSGKIILDGEELFQLVYIKIHEGYRRGTIGSANLTPEHYHRYILSVAHNVLRDSVKTRINGNNYREQHLLFTDLTEDTEMLERVLPQYEENVIESDQQETFAAINEFFSTPESIRMQGREIITMDHEGYSYQDIADQLGLPIGTVKSRISRLKARLREILTVD